VPSLQPGRPKRTTRPPSVTLDPWHTTIVVRVCQADAARAAAGERTWLRLAEAHEFCGPGPCTTSPSMARVVALGIGVRLRMPIDVPGAAA